MENISRALLMAAGILLAMLTIGIAMILFRAGAGVSIAFQNNNEKNELNTFNSNFTKMLTGNDDKVTNATQRRSDTITVYDVISVANFAWDNNCKYVDDPRDTTYNNDPRMLRVGLYSSSGSLLIDNLQNYNQKAYDLIIQRGNFNKNSISTGSNQLPKTVYYKIDIAGYSSVGRINRVNFSPKSDATVDSELSGAIGTITGDNRYKR